MSRPRSALSLVELLVGLVLLGLVMLGLSNIEMFSRSTFFHADRSFRVQNEVSLVLQHMHKYVAMGISSDAVTAIDMTPVVNPTPGESVRVWIDSNQTGSLNAFCPSRATDAAAGGDTLVAYVFDSAANKVYHYNDYACNPSARELLATNIETFEMTKIGNNSLSVEISGCGTVDASCGVSRDNPKVNLTTVIILPSVAAD